MLVNHTNKVERWGPAPDKSEWELKPVPGMFGQTFVDGDTIWTENEADAKLKTRKLVQFDHRGKPLVEWPTGDRYHEIAFLVPDTNFMFATDLFHFYDGAGSTDRLSIWNIETGQSKLITIQRTGSASAWLPGPRLYAFTEGDKYGFDNSVSFYSPEADRLIHFGRKDIFLPSVAALDNDTVLLAEYRDYKVYRIDPVKQSVKEFALPTVARPHKVESCRD